MKKIINYYKNYHPSKPLLFLYLLIPIFFSFFALRCIDSDFWFIVNIGRYITNHGFYKIDPFTIHEGLKVVIQQWPVDLLFYHVYNIFSSTGIWILMIILFSSFVFLIYRLCKLICEKDSLSILITCLTASIFIVGGYFVTRPQIFDFIFLVIELFILEKYIKTNNYKVLFILPIISILYINFHASTWIMLFLFMLPFIVDSFNFKILFFKGEGYNKKWLFIIFIVMLLCGFINPYGIDAMTYFFKGTDSVINSIVLEMYPLYKIKSLTLLFCSMVILSVIFYSIKNYKNIKIRYLCLQLGTLFMTLISYKSFSYFVLVSFIPLSFYLDNYFKKCESRRYSRKFITEYIVTIAIFLSLSLFISLNSDITLNLIEDFDTVIDYMNKNVSKDEPIYTGYNIGGYLEWNGYKPYIDARAEVFLKSLNGKADIIKEYANIKYEDLEKYNFNYFLISNGSKLDNYFKEHDDEFNLLYEQKNKKTTYYLYNSKK